MQILELNQVIRKIKLFQKSEEKILDGGIFQTGVAIWFLTALM